MKTILLAINPDREHEARVRAAISLTKRCGSHLTCTQVIAPPVIMGDPTAAIVVPGANDVLMRQADEVQEKTEALLRESEVEWTWVRLVADAASAIVSQSRLADLIILGSKGSHPPAAPVTIHARVPVLALPPAEIDMQARSPALVAWNGSAASANALRAALPLLRQSTAVHILTVGERDADFGPERASEYLKHHAVTAQLDHVESSRAPISDTIIRRAEELRAGVIVAGAFGHNRIREMLIGSVTHALLRGSRIPLLLAH